VQNPRFPYDVAALNNLYGSAGAAQMTTEISAPRAGTRALSDQQQQRLDAALADLRTIAADLDGQPEALLTLLRQIEQLHRNLQDGPFRSSLPADRTELFNLLRAMEESGGWPYIPRLQLRTFMDLLQRDRSDDEHPLAA